MTKILLVEDDKSLREIYGVRLLAEGYDIVSAGDGEEALAMAIKERPDLILSDVMMPKISGFDMLDILRSTTETKDIKVIIMTALSSEDQRLRGESLGADMYLVKSQVGIEDVVRSVKEVLARPPVVREPKPLPNIPVGDGQAPVANTASTQPTSQPIPAQTQPTPQPTPQPAPQPAPNPIPQTAPQASQPSQQPSQPTSTPTPAQSTPQPLPTPASNGGSLPQPTAPFSTPRERSANTLGERVIQPPVRPEGEKYDVAKAMADALSSSERDRREVQPDPSQFSSVKDRESPQGSPYQPQPSQPTTPPTAAPQPIPAQPQMTTQPQAQLPTQQPPAAPQPVPQPPVTAPPAVPSNQIPQPPQSTQS